MKPNGEICSEYFSGGVRMSAPLAAALNEPAGLEKLVRVSWSLARPALDRDRQLVRIVDLPASRIGDREMMGQEALTEDLPLAAADAKAVADAVFGDAGIEIEGATYVPKHDGRSPHWRFSPSLGRLCGRLVLARVEEPCSAGFLRYLLHINRDLRFTQVGRLRGAIALQAVLPAEDRSWAVLAQEALTAVYEVLRAQVVWWDQPRELLDELLGQAAL